MKQCTQYAIGFRKIQFCIKANCIRGIDLMRNGGYGCDLINKAVSNESNLQ